MDRQRIIIYIHNKYQLRANFDPKDDNKLQF